MLKDRIGRQLAFLSRRLTFLILILLLASCSSQKAVVHGLDEREANDIIVYLSGKGLEASKTKVLAGGGAGGNEEPKWDIEVAAEDYDRALSLLSAGGFPRRKGDSLLNIFAKGGLVPSDLEEKIRYQAGLGEQIANTIRKIDGVLDATVQIAFPEQDPLNPQKTIGDVKASVYVKHTGVLDDPNTQLIPRIRRLVSSSIPGLKYDNVTVIPDRARFSDVNFIQEGGKSNEEKDYVSIWSVIIAKESARTFRILFFSLSMCVLIFLLAVIWLGWKFYPILQSLGGYKALLDIHPITTARVKGEEDPVKTEAQKEENEEEKKPEDEEGVT